ncbi:MAG: glycerol-3-phosphate acyltransferase, partial [Desulfobacterales bacterium]|nr:glycerol-3-phosphate acyltransferase [Desulfobacterales bacterium]
AQAKVLRYAKEIVPAFNAYIYFRIGYWIAKRVARLLYRVRVGLFADQQYASIDMNSTVVFVMNHRGNMDYILTAFLAAERTTLSYAVGEWARIWPLHTLIRAMGAYFVRRNSGNPLYRVVLERYIHMATREGVCQAMFPEGGLSRDGLLRPPKYGLVDYMLRGFDPKKDRDIIFIPVGINYDRTLEDRSLLRALDPEAKKRSMWFVVKTSFWFMWRSVILITLSRWQRFGYACVNFGPHVSAREFCEEHGLQPDIADRETRFAAVKTLSHQIMDEIARVIPVLPVSVISTVMLDAPEEGLDAFAVEARANDLITELEAQNAPVYTAYRSRAQILMMALNMLKTRRLIVDSDGLYKVDPENTHVLQYYANSIAHWIRQ